MVAFIPGQMSYFECADVKDCVQTYKSVFGNPDEEEVKLQYLQWKEFCSALEEPPMTPLETLEIIPKRLGHIKNLLTIFCTVPVTTCSVERTFSALRILKNYLRNRTSYHLTGLALMYIHPKIKINIEDVINRFSGKKKRRFDFAL